MRVVIHAGLHKTGTTSLQRILNANRDLLVQHGVLYPPAGRAVHHNFIINAGQPDFDTGRVAAVCAQARQNGVELLLLSAECISVLSGDALRRLTSCFGADPVSFVVTLRHWSSFLPSRYAQNCKRRDAQTFAEYLGRVVDPARRHPDFYYDSVVEVLADAGHALSVVSYDHAVQADGVVAAVLRAAGLPDTLIAELEMPPKRANQSPNWQTAELLRLLNGAASARLNRSENALFDAIGERSAFRDVFFDFYEGMSRLDPGHVAVAEDWLSPQAEPAPPVPDGCGLIEERLVERFGAQLVNARDGRLFPPESLRAFSRPVTSTTWQVFQAWNPALVGVMLDQLLRPSGADVSPRLRLGVFATGSRLWRRLRSLR